MPVLAVGAGYIPAFGGDVTINYAKMLPALRFLYRGTGFQKSDQTL
jgi:hypothetical protein